jgi:hypothetical protein
MLKWNIGHKKITCKNTSLYHNGMDVRSGFCENFATSSLVPSVASVTNK